MSEGPFLIRTASGEEGPYTVPEIIDMVNRGSLEVGRKVWDLSKQRSIRVDDIVAEYAPISTGGSNEPSTPFTSAAPGEAPTRRSRGGGRGGGRRRSAAAGVQSAITWLLVIGIAVVVLIVVLNMRPQAADRDTEMRLKAETVLDINRFPPSEQRQIRSFINKHHARLYNETIVTLGYGNGAIDEYFIGMGRVAKDELNPIYVRNGIQTRVGGFTLGFGRAQPAAPTPPKEYHDEMKEKAEAAMDVDKFGSADQPRIRSFIQQAHPAIYDATIKKLGYGRASVDKYLYELGSKAKDELNDFYVQAGVKTRVGGVTLGNKPRPVPPPAPAPVVEEPAPEPEPAPAPPPAPEPKPEKPKNQGMESVL